jgi:hypothetical protein
MGRTLVAAGVVAQISCFKIKKEVILKSNSNYHAHQ